MEKYIRKADVMAEIDRLCGEHTSIGYRDDVALVLEDLEDFLDTLEVKEVEEITASDKHIAAVTVKEAIERKIINSPFALKGAYSGKMYFYSWKKSISKMPENIANLKLSMNFDNNYKELDSYNIEPRVRFVKSTFDCRPFLEPYVLVWVSDYELAKKGE